MTKNTKINTDSQMLIELISRDDVQSEFGEAVASMVSSDQVITWAKFILTDDKPNGNRERIPEEEFDNIIRTGIFKPVKMAVGEIKDGHEDAQPLGVITHLAKEGNKILGLAALWDKERGDDVSYIKNLVKSNKPVNVSWEVLYGDASLNDGITDLRDTVLRAVTIVGIPAYAGRTQFVAIAAKKWTPSYIESLPDENFLLIEKDGSRYFPYRDHTGKIDVKRFPDIMDEMVQSHLPENTLKGIRHQVRKMSAAINSDASLRELLDVGDEINLEDSTLDTKELEGKVSELEAKLATASDELSQKEAALADALAKAEQANTLVQELQEELLPLKEFKQKSDEDLAKAVKLSEIKEKFKALNKPEEYFVENEEKLLSLDAASLDFMLQEMVAFKDSDQGAGEGEASLRTSGIPNIPGQGGEVAIKDLASALRDRKNKK